MLFGSECKGKSYKYTEEVAPSHTDPRYVYERDREVRKRWWDVRDHATIFDLGAEYGHWTLCALAQGARMVYAVETDKSYQLMIKINLTSNLGYIERAGVIKRDIKLDQFIEHLSCPPPSIQYIRLSERYTRPEAIEEFISHGSDTISRYKPSLIACFERNNQYLHFNNVISTLGMSYNNRQFTCNQDEYSLITFS